MNSEHVSNGEKALGFRHLPKNAVVKETLPILHDGRWLYYRAPALHWKYSCQLQDRINKNLDIVDPTNYQIVIVSNPQNAHDYSAELYVNLTESEIGKNKVTEYTSTPYPGDIEDRVKILNDKVPETVFIVASLITVEDYVMVNRLASKYRKYPEVKKIVLISPFMGGQREDKNAKLIEGTDKVIFTEQAMTAASNIEILAQNFDEIRNFETHSSASPTWAAEYKIPFAPISLWKLMVNKFKDNISELGEIFNPKEYTFICPDKGRNMGAKKIQEFLEIENRVNFEKNRDDKGNLTFKDLNPSQIESIRDKNLLLYDDEVASFKTLKGVVNKLVKAEASVKSITIMLGHVKLTKDYIDNHGVIRSVWKENVDEIISIAKSKNIKIKFYISDSREPLSDIHSYAKEHEGMFEFVGVTPLITQVIEAEINQQNLWRKGESPLIDLIIQARTPEEEQEENE